ncbi:MAG TPA: alpha/beta hydrolase [Allosphingosinicella sp.]
MLSAVALTLALSACAPGTPPSAVGEVAVTPEIITARATEKRQVQIQVFAPARPKGVLVFGHGAGGSPDRYLPLFARLNAAGYAVMAPVHVDSLQNPEHARYDLQTAFGERIADVGAAARAAAERFPGLPLAAVGHSYGALFAQMQGGALRYITDVRANQVRAVVSFSSPGIIPGLVRPDVAFSTVAVPSLAVTGTADVIPGFVSNWEDHLAAFRGAPAGGRYALVLPGAEHDLIVGGKQENFVRAVDVTILFLNAHLLGDTSARRRLDAPTSGIQLR